MTDTLTLTPEHLDTRTRTTLTMILTREQFEDRERALLAPYGMKSGDCARPGLS